VAGPCYGSQSEPGKGLADAWCSDTLPFSLREAKFRFNPQSVLPALSERAPEKRGRRDSKSPMPGFRFHVTHHAGAPEPPACLRVRDISPPSKVLKCNLHTQPAKRGGNWYLVPALPPLYWRKGRKEGRGQDEEARCEPCLSLGLKVCLIQV